MQRREAGRQRLLPGVTATVPQQPAYQPHRAVHTRQVQHTDALYDPHTVTLHIRAVAATQTRVDHRFQLVQHRVYVVLDRVHRVLQVTHTRITVLRI